MRTEKEWYRLVRHWEAQLWNISDYEGRPANARIMVQAVIGEMKEILASKGKRE